MDNKLVKRKIVRLQNKENYSLGGMYFVTICTRNKKCLFGQIHNATMNMNQRGEMIEKNIFYLESKFQGMKIKEHIVMPNHVHFVLELMNYNVKETDGIIKAMQWFKTMTTNEYIRNVKLNNWIRFDKTLWQRSFYEHIIRNEKQLLEILNYMQNNPISWEIDKLHNIDNYQ